MKKEINLFKKFQKKIYFRKKITKIKNKKNKFKTKFIEEKRKK